MDWLLYLLGGGAAAFVILLIWGMARIRRNQAKAYDAIKAVDLADIDPLAAECVAVFRTKLGVDLDPNDPEDAARKLDAALADRTRIKNAFKRDDFYWYCVKPVGAFLGELLRRHAGHEWVKEPGEAPAMTARAGDTTSTTYPFEKAVKQLTIGDAGDLVAYVAVARSMGTAARKV